MKRFVVLVMMLFIHTGIVFGDELHLVLNGKSIHMENKNLNEKNWGLGVEYLFEEKDNWIPMVAASGFKDSNKQMSYYFGGGAKRRFYLGNRKDGWHIDGGLFGFIMTRKDYKNNDPFIAALPFVSVGTEKVAVNVTYIPSVTPKHVALFYFQLVFKVAEF